MNNQINPKTGKPYKSWELRKKDPNQYRYTQKQDEIFIRKPGSIAGEQFVIENCKNCNIYILDHSATIFIDECTDCKIFLGPVESSVFIRDCYRCKMIIACGQFRSRKCEDIQILLMCQSQPIIESSIRMGFGCFRCAYKEFEYQLEKANISRWNNTWSDIFDFTVNYRENENHFYQMLEDKLFEDLMPNIYQIYNGVDANWEQDVKNQVIPFSSEQRLKQYNDEVLLLFYPDNPIERDKLTPYFQPQSNEQQFIYVEDGDEPYLNQMEVDPWYLVKSKYAYIFPENYDLFKNSINTYLTKEKAEQFLDKLVVNYRIQLMFSLHIRSQRNDKSLLQSLKSLFRDVLKINYLEEVCLVFTDHAEIEDLAALVFANMKDERAQK